MDKSIGSSVGQGGTNRADDVRTVQELLNNVPVTWGGPSVPLDVDGLVGDKTITAIRNFQQVQLSTFFSPDGRVDPRQRSIGRLNHIAQTSERPGGTLLISVEPISHMIQPTNMVCWAAAGTMLISARDHMSYSISAAMQRADAADLGYGYLNMFNNNVGLPPADTRRYTRALGLKVGPAASFTVARRSSALLCDSRHRRRWLVAVPAHSRYHRDARRRQCLWNLLYRPRSWTFGSLLRVVH